MRPSISGRFLSVTETNSGRRYRDNILIVRPIVTGKARTNHKRAAAKAARRNAKLECKS
jgi:hypothetical protein